MQKLEKIILNCLSELVEQGHLDELEKNGKTAKIICTTVRKVVAEINRGGK